MKNVILVLVLLVASAGTTASAHRLNEYLLATSIAIEKDHLVLRMHLTAGELVAEKVLAVIDQNHDGKISSKEQNKYITRIRGDMELLIDGKIIPLQLHALSFPEVDDIRNGIGDMLVTFDALIAASPKMHQLIFTNHHQKKIGVYLANCLVPNDPLISIESQTRNPDQSIYRLNFTIHNNPEATLSLNQKSLYAGKNDLKK